MKPSAYRAYTAARLPIHDFGCICVSTQAKLRKADAYLASADMLMQSVPPSMYLKLAAHGDAVRNRRYALYNRGHYTRSDVVQYKARATFYFEQVLSVVNGTPYAGPSKPVRSKKSHHLAPAQPYMPVMTQNPRNMDQLVSMVQPAAAPRSRRSASTPSAPRHHPAENYYSPPPAVHRESPRARTRTASSPRTPAQPSPRSRRATQPSPRPIKSKRVHFHSPLNQTRTISPRPSPLPLSPRELY